MTAEEIEEWADSVGCECEMDYSCGMHAGQVPYIDRRFQGADTEEARAYGRIEDLF
jgi:hypothetical protein